METIQLKLTKEQLTNLEVFLSRINLGANEIPAFQDIVRAIIAAKTPQEPKKNGKSVEPGDK